ncbi:MAG: hypothetical protein V9H69_16770 [Anaerolineae bacterium]
MPAGARVLSVEFKINKTSEVAGPDEKLLTTLKPGLIAHPATSEVSM